MEKKLDLILQKLNDLEKRVGTIEESLSSYIYLSSTHFQDDEKLVDAIRLIRPRKEVDCAYLQTSLDIGYARAARLMDQLEARKYVKKSGTVWRVNKELLQKIQKAQEFKFKTAIGIISEFDKASASLLQRRLKIGYAEAAGLLDRLEEEGYVSPPDGSKPREVLKNKVRENIRS